MAVRRRIGHNVLIIGAKRVPSAEDTWMWASDGKKFIENGTVKTEGLIYVSTHYHCLALPPRYFSFDLEAASCEKKNILCESNFLSVKTVYMKQDQMP